jgi:hypothetical protein
MYALEGIVALSIGIAVYYFVRAIFPPKAIKKQK